MGVTLITGEGNCLIGKCSLTSSCSDVVITTLKKMVDTFCGNNVQFTRNYGRISFIGCTNLTMYPTHNPNNDHWFLRVSFVTIIFFLFQQIATIIGSMSFAEGNLQMGNLLYTLVKTRIFPFYFAMLGHSQFYRNKYAANGLLLNKVLQFQGSV